MNEQYFTSLNGYYVKDKEAIHTYDSVAEMKADSKIKEGSYVKTRGYHNVNDGGNAEYIIVNDNNLIEDDMFIHKLANNLFAKLIINNKVNIRTIGATLDNDIHDYILAIIDKDLECFIPQGIWKTSPLQIAKYNSSRIIGYHVYGNNNSNGTILTPIENQDYIIKVGYDNNTSICSDVTIKNIQFNTNEYTCVNALLLSRVQFSNFDEISFYNCKCTDSAFRIRETWESKFGRMLFRTIDSPYAMIFGEKVGSGNISANYFEFLSFECCRGTCIKFEENSQYSMSTINTIDFESGVAVFENETRVLITDVDSYTSLSIIETGNGKGEISINNINLNSIAQHAYVNSDTNTTRAYDTVIKCNNTDAGFYSFAINNISGVGNAIKPTLINANTIDKFHCNNNIFQGGTYFNSYINGCRVFKYLNSKFADNFINANLDQQYRDLTVYENKIYCTSKDHGVRVARLTTQGNKLMVHAKGSGQIYFGSTDHVTLSSVSEYEWKEITMSANNLGDYSSILLASNSNLEIDDYFFINETI